MADATSASSPPPSAAGAGGGPEAVDPLTVSTVTAFAGPVTRTWTVRHNAKDYTVQLVSTCA